MRKKSTDYAEAHGRYTARAVLVDEADARLLVSEAEHTQQQLELAKVVKKGEKLFQDLKKLGGKISENHGDAICAGLAAVGAANSSMAGEADRPFH